MLLEFIQNRSSFSVLDLLFMVIGYSIIILFILPVHEFAHAWAAHLCGDDTAKWNGRLTLNPFAHLTAWGTAMLVLCGIGYAKPVPVNSYNLRNPKRDMIFISLAGPMSNLLMAIAAAGIYKICTLVVTDIAVLSLLFLVLIRIIMSVNVGLAVFNLLPVPPLDGSRLWSSLLPRRLAFTLEQYSRQITMVLFVLLLLGVLDRPLQFLNSLFFLGIGRLFGL